MVGRYKRGLEYCLALRTLLSAFNHGVSGSVSTPTPTAISVSTLEHPRSHPLDLFFLAPLLFCIMPAETRSKNAAQRPGLVDLPRKRTKPEDAAAAQEAKEAAKKSAKSAKDKKEHEVASLGASAAAAVAQQRANRVTHRSSGTKVSCQ